MKLRKSLLIYAISLTVLSFILIVNIFNAKADSTKIAPVKTETEVAEEVQNGGKILLEPTEKMWKNAIDMTSNHKQENEQLQKWIIRIIMEETLKNNEIKIADAVKAAKERYAFEQAWLELAAEKYKITYTDDEVDEWIKNGPDKYPIPAMEVQAKALGLTLEEMNHSYDRDFYVKWVVWDKLLPILAENNDIAIKNVEVSTDKSSPHNLLVEKYEEEVKQFLNEKGL
ncbi:hypothetical protein [Planococcus shixiaomingii]|uniref:hypothetical protein n=1 Tax=Planococcus shixiaomingii TaxID=3058393 RepID=UPI002635AB91|nr:hypothetical protein [Planococcus sp. N022]WKA53564.1 hypothetical protein QWY21_12935 [Planococcus sp. N022]